MQASETSPNAAYGHHLLHRPPESQPSPLLGLDARALDESRLAARKIASDGDVK
jgi:hypothetical protein